MRNLIESNLTDGNPALRVFSGRQVVAMMNGNLVEQTRKVKTSKDARDLLVNNIKNANNIGLNETVNAAWDAIIQQEKPNNVKKENDPYYKLAIKIVNEIQTKNQKGHINNIDQATTLVMTTHTLQRVEGTNTKEQRLGIIAALGQKLATDVKMAQHKFVELSDGMKPEDRASIGSAILQTGGQYITQARQLIEAKQKTGVSLSKTQELAAVLIDATLVTGIDSSLQSAAASRLWKEAKQAHPDFEPIKKIYLEGPTVIETFIDTIPKETQLAFLESYKYISTGAQRLDFNTAKEQTKERVKLEAKSIAESPIVGTLSGVYRRDDPNKTTILQPAFGITNGKISHFGEAQDLLKEEIDQIIGVSGVSAHTINQILISGDPNMLNTNHNVQHVTTR